MSVYRIVLSIETRVWAFFSYFVFTFTKTAGWVCKNRTVYSGCSIGPKVATCYRGNGP